MKVLVFSSNRRERNTALKPRVILAGLLPALITATGLCVGCSGNGAADVVAAANDSNAKRLCNLYQSFAARNGWRSPKDEAEFKGFIRAFPAHRLELMGIDPEQVDALFVSERDGQPFQIKYGIDSGLGARIAIVFEQQGEDGKRVVGFTDGSIEQADSAQYKNLRGDSERPGSAKAA